MEFIDFFAGIGGIRLGLEKAGHKCVGFCEIDKYARASYISMHLLSESDRQYLLGKKKYERIREIESFADEWNADDVSRLHGRSVPNSDCWCFGAPCTSFSHEGNREGMDGESGLIREIFRLLREKADRPEWLIYENVEGVLTSRKGLDFLGICLEMESLGYDIEWQLLNSRDFGVPQNRRRLYTIGHLRDRGERHVLPIIGNRREGDIRVGEYLKIIDGTKRGWSEAYYGDSVDYAFLNSAKRRGRVGKQVAHTLKKTCYQAVVTKDLRLRRLTPLECFRLQGFEDEYFKRAEMICSDTQLYKQIGNSVTVNVIYEIGKRM